MDRLQSPAEAVESLSVIADRFDAIVFDQWGVLHDGSTPYVGGPDALAHLHASGHRLAVLSNSGKRADNNARRIADMGYPKHLFDVIMTSGEALWLDFRNEQLGGLRSLYPVTAKPGDAERWADGLNNIELTNVPNEAQAVLVMGLADDADSESMITQLNTPPLADLPMICSNPDRASPRGGGRTVVSPGAIAHARADSGGDVRFYGKPHRAIFEALQRELGCAPERILMVGDSFEHDIAGGHAAGWKTLFVQGGLYAEHFPTGVDAEATIAKLSKKAGSPLPDFTIHQVC